MVPKCRLAALALLSPVALAPAIAPARVGPSIRELTEIADIEALAASSDGRRVAFRILRPSIEANSYRITWYVADLDAKSVRGVADGGQPIYHDGSIEAEPPVWSADGSSVFHRILADGAVGIWRTSADGTESRKLIDSDADIERFHLALDRSTLVYVTGPARERIARAERDEYDRGILIDARIDPAQSLVGGGFVHGRRASQRLVGRWYQREGLLWEVSRTEHRLHLATGRITTSSVPAPSTEPLAIDRAAAGAEVRSDTGDAARLVVSGSEGNEVEVRRADGSVVRCRSVGCTRDRIVALAWRPSSSELILTTQDRHFRQALLTWNHRTGVLRAIYRGSGQLSGSRLPSTPCTVTRTSAVCVSAGPAVPPMLLRIDLSNGRSQILFDPNRTIRERPAPRVEHLSLALPDGREATGILLVPPRRRVHRAPLFLTYYHCPGYLRGGTGDEFPQAPLVDAGFVVACLNIVPFDSWGDGLDRYRAALASVRELVALLDRRGLIDPSRVGMGGFSAGSEATMYVATNSDLLAAAAVASPQYEPSSYWMNSVRGRDYPRVLEEFLQVKAPGETKERWRAISPALNVDRMKAPLLMQLPEQEVRAAMELYAKLSRTSTPVELYGFPDEAHVKLQPRHRLAVYERNLAWFRFWLQDQAPVSPALAGEYRRWIELRRRRTITH